MLKPNVELLLDVAPGSVVPQGTVYLIFICLLVHLLVWDSDGDQNLLNVISLLFLGNGEYFVATCQAHLVELVANDVLF